MRCHKREIVRSVVMHSDASIEPRATLLLWYATRERLPMIASKRRL